MAKISCTMDDGSWDELIVSNNQVHKDKVKKYQNEGQEWFIVTLHFDDLSHITYVNVNSDIHNGWLVQRVETMSMCINKMIQLCGFTSTIGATMMPGVAGVQQGLEKDAGNKQGRDKEQQPEEQSNLGEGIVYRGGRVPSAAKAVTLATRRQQQGESMKRKGKPIIYFHCGSNQLVLEFSDLPLKERQKIMVHKNTKWEKQAADRKVVRQTNKQKLQHQVVGQVHAQISVDNIEEWECHQDDKNDFFFGGPCPGATST